MNPFIAFVLLPALTGQVPVSRTQEVAQIHHGRRVVDPYRWLEDGKSTEVKAWTQTQNKYSRSYLDHLPAANLLRKEIREILSAPVARYREVTLRGGYYFAVKHEPPRQQPFIVMTSRLENANDARVVFDPNVVDASGQTSMDWYEVSPDGTRIAVSLSRGGSELGTLSVFDVRSGKRLERPIPHVNSGTAGGSLAWTPDSDAFFYTRHFPIDPQQPDDGRVYQHVYYHRLGSPQRSDYYELGRGLPAIAEIQLSMHPTTGRLLATVQKGDGGEFAHYLREPRGKWRQFSRFGDRIVQAVFADDRQLYLVSLADAPRGQILSLPVGSLNLEEAQVLIPESMDTIVSSGTAFWGEQTVVPTKHRLYVVYQLGGPSEIRAFDRQGTPVAKPSQLDVSTVYGLERIGDDDLLFGNVSFVDPPAYYRFQSATHRIQKTALATTSPFSMHNAVVRREFAQSSDGTRVPLNIVMRKDMTLDGNTPCLVTGYGGYGVNVEPRFRALNSLYLRHGLIFVTTNLRGGGEYGEQWHRQGNLINKQNVFDDFAACLNLLVDAGYTRPDRLGIVGGSNGGLLMGALLTQHPDLVRAVVSFVGIYDMLRVELSPNGAFNVTEFGTVQNRDHFEAMIAYSPYHKVRDTTAYPATLFLTGENDPRVDPLQSRKMTARLQAANHSSHPILLRTSANAGHGAGNSLQERIEQSVDMMAFLFHELGVATQP